MKGKTFKKLKCAPKQTLKVDSKLKKKSCLTNDFLVNLRDKYNSTKKNKIKTNDGKEIWKKLKKSYKNCKNELCWIKKLDIKGIMQNDIFRPLSPNSWSDNPYTWLSSKDIEDVMFQYEKSYRNFKFIGPSPIDYDEKRLFDNCVWEELCKFDLKKLYNMDKKKIGIIFNLDPHYKSGSHWVAVFIDLEKNYIMYFDSNGDKVKNRIKKFIDNVIKQATMIGLNLKFYSNYKFVHQMKDGQCGLYSLYVIIKLLREELTPKELKKTRISDKVMENYREIYYNKI